MITVSDVLNMYWLQSDTKVTIMLRVPGELNGCAVASGSLSQSQITAYNDYEVQSFYYDSKRNVVVINVEGDLII